MTYRGQSATCDEAAAAIVPATAKARALMRPSPTTPPGGSAGFYWPKRRARCWNVRIARRKSISRNAGQYASQK